MLFLKSVISFISANWKIILFAAIVFFIFDKGGDFRELKKDKEFAERTAELEKKENGRQKEWERKVTAFQNDQGDKVIEAVKGSIVAANDARDDTKRALDKMNASMTEYVNTKPLTVITKAGDCVPSSDYITGWNSLSNIVKEATK